MSLEQKKDPKEYVVVKLSTGQDNETKLRAKLLFPIELFKWDKRDYSPAVQSIFSELLLWAEGLDETLIRIVKSRGSNIEAMVLFGILNSPEPWKKELLAGSPEKLQFYSTTARIVIAGYFFDDTLEGFLENPRAKELGHQMLTTLERILRQEFTDFEQVQHYVKTNCDPLFMSPGFQFAVASQQSAAERLRDVHGIDANEYLHFIYKYKAAFDYALYMEGKEISSRSLGLWETVRVHTGAGYALIEFQFAMGGMEIPMSIRMDKYWERLRFLSSILGAMANDFVSFEKELREGKRDSMVMFWINQGDDESLETGIQKAVEYHNKYVEELVETVAYIRSGKHQIPTDDSDPAVAEGLRKLYMESVEVLLGICMSVLQSMLSSPRYSQRYHFE